MGPLYNDTRSNQTKDAIIYVNKDPHALTEWHLRDLISEQIEADNAAESAELDALFPKGIPDDYWWNGDPKLTAAGRRIQKWLDILETPGLTSHTSTVPTRAEGRSGYEDDTDDAPSQASVFEVKVGYHRVEKDDGESQDSCGREFMSAHDTCIIIYEIKWSRGEIDDNSADEGTMDVWTPSKHRTWADVEERLN